MSEINTLQSPRESPESLKNILERRYKSFIDIEDSGFFRGLASYVGVVIKSPMLFNFVDKKIQAENNEIIEKINTLSEQCERELKKTGKTLLRLIEKHKIKSEKIETEVNKYKKFRDGKVSYADYHQISHFNLICNILRVLKNEGFDGITNKFTSGSTLDPKEISTFSPAYQPLFSAIDEYKNRRETEIWGSWQRIWLVYMIIHNLKQLDKMIGDPDNTYIRLTNALDLIADFKSILSKDPKEKLPKYIRDNYLEHIHSVHNALMDEIEGIVNESNEKKKPEVSKQNYPLELYYSGSTLSAKGTAIKYVTLVNTQSEGPGLLLDPLFKICRVRPTQWHRISKKKLSSNKSYDDSEMSEALKKTTEDPEGFKKYLSKIGLRSPIREFFVAKANTDFKLKFRIAITNEEWNSFSKDRKKNVVNYFSNDQQFKR